VRSAIRSHKDSAGLERKRPVAPRGHLVELLALNEDHRLQIGHLMRGQRVGGPLRRDEGAVRVAQLQHEQVVMVGGYRPLSGADHPNATVPRDRRRREAGAVTVNVASAHPSG